MNRAVFIIPYYGQLPDILDLWLKSAAYNKSFDFIFLTDLDIVTGADNVKVIKMPFLYLKSLIQNCVDFKICLDEPYKLNDYSPLYGEALASYINNYEFWGYCDIDMILGNLDDFINTDVLNHFDKIYRLGSMTLIRNNEKCNRLWRTKHFIDDAYRYDEAFRTPYVCHFDEEDGISEIADYAHVHTYDSVDFADLDYSHFNFVMLGRESQIQPHIFEWNHGTLFVDSLGKENNLIRQEIAYVHFQKRHMKIQISRDDNHYLMVPNKFIPFKNDIITLLLHQNMEQTYPEFNRIRKNEIKNNIKRHAIQQRIYRRLFQKINRRYF